MKIKSLFLVGLLILSMCVSACSFFQNEKEQSEQEKTSVSVTEPAKPEEVVLKSEEVFDAKGNALKQGESVVIKKSAFLVKVYDAEKRVLLSVPCALGKNPGQKEKEGDMKTPNGTFKVEEIIDSSWWTHDFGDGKGEIKDAYGPWFIYLNTMELSKGKWDGIGIHGTHDPASIGTLASEGCIRLKNEDIVKLKKLVRVGMPVKIEE